jgi:hypothetical protein
MPPGSAHQAELAKTPYGWTHSDTLLADVFEALTGTPHPGKPTPNAARARANDSIKRLKEQRERLKKKENTECPPA